MRCDVIAELKELRLHGMAGAWADLTVQGAAAMDSSRWLIEHLLQAETTDRAMRSVRNQLNAAKLPAHRDLAGFDFTVSRVSCVPNQKPMHVSAGDYLGLFPPNQVATCNCMYLFNMFVYLDVTGR